jgi:hypothetical protein
MGRVYASLLVRHRDSTETDCIDKLRSVPPRSCSEDVVTDPTSRPFPDRPPTPRWLKLLVVVGVLILLAVVAVTLLTGASHGPGMHGG